MKTYLGARVNGEAIVVVVERDHSAKMLPLGLEHVRHSPTGFEWGYGGSGPAQLAFAILLDHFKDVNRARAWYQPFKWKVIANLQGCEWELSSEKIELALLDLKEGGERAGFQTGTI